MSDQEDIREVEVKELAFDDGRPSEDWTVPRLRVGRYEKAFTLFSKRLEVQRIAFVLDRPLKDIEALEPKHYERIVAADMAVNRRFFAYCRRQAEWKVFLLDAQEDSAGTGSTSQSAQG